MTHPAKFQTAVPVALTPVARVVRQSGAISAEIDGEVVALDATRGVCYGLNRTGSRVWQLIETPASVAEICAALLAEFKVDAADCERQVLELLDALRSEGLILVAPAESATPGS